MKYASIVENGDAMIVDPAMKRLKDYADALSATCVAPGMSDEWLSWVGRRVVAINAIRRNMNVLLLDKFTGNDGWRADRDKVQGNR